MATVRFTTTCDVLGCGKRAEEYSAWPTCRDCGEDICTEHQVPGSDTEDECGLCVWCVCLECNAFDDAPSPSEPMDPAEVLRRAEAFDILPELQRIKDANLSAEETLAQQIQAALSGYNASMSFTTHHHEAIMHPDCVEVAWKFDRWHHQVDYSRFAKNQLKQRDGITPTGGDYEYGLTLRKVAANG